MIASDAQPAVPESPTGLTRSLGFDFALLGLNARESRVEVIRKAAAQTAQRIQEAAAGDDDDREAMLGDLATSTYRLLDPRRRQKAMERIQLSLFGEVDFERQQLARTPLLGLATPERSRDEESQLREIKREIVQQLLSETRATTRRVGTITLSLLAMLVLLASAVITVCS
ncbi:MAG: hypothetical protein R3C53_13720 [Pirellulaceae bacterium]